MNHCSIFGNCETGSGSVFCTYDSNSRITCSDCFYGPKQQTKSEKGKIDFGTPSESFINSYKFLVLGSCKTEMKCLEEIRTKFHFPSFMLRLLLRLFLNSILLS